MRPRNICITLLLLMPTSVFAQITITQQDISTIVDGIANGVEWSSQDTSGLRALLVKNGPDQTWDFTQFNYSLSPSKSPATLMDPKDAPLNTDPHLAGATLVARVEELDTLHYYSFVKFTAEGWWILGQVVDRNGVVSLSNYSEPPEQFFKLPLSYLTTWQSDYTQHILEYNDTQRYSTSNAVDGYGTLLLPGGRSIPAIRLVRTMDQEYRIFEWLTQTGVYLTARMGPSGEIYDVSYTQPTTGAVAQEAHVDQRFNIAPNPAADRTTLTLSSATAVAIDILDALGRSVQNAAVNTIADGRYSLDLSGLRPGAYYVRVSNVTNTETKLLVVLPH
jgi:hypothetical protein